MIKSVPFVPFKLSIALKFSRFFLGLGGILEKLMPRLELTLNQAEFGFEGRQYAAIAIFSMIFWFSLIFSLFALLGAFLGLEQFLHINLAVSLTIGMLSFIYIVMYPNLVITRKMRSIEKSLLYGLRDMTIQIKAGVPLFDALASVSKKDYGKLTDECRECVKRISTGVSAPEALEEMTMKNPSRYFRRSMWQITNSLRTGSNLGETMDNIVTSIANDQKVEIRKYGSQLNPMAMMYMMLGVIIPSIGITFLIILSSFSGMPVTKMVFWSILVVLLVFQIAFIGIVKSRRPSIEI